MIEGRRTEFWTEIRGTNLYEGLRTLLLETSIRDGRPFYDHSISGYSHDDVESLMEDFTELKLVYEYKDSDVEMSRTYIVEGRDFAVNVFKADTRFDIDVGGYDLEKVNTYLTQFRGKLGDAPAKGTVYLLAHEQSYHLTELGDIDHKLERNNYTPEVLAQFDRVIEDLQSEVPAGRLTILDGEPGTGKSFLIRGLVSSAKGLYIYVPSAVAGHVTAPEIIPVLMREKSREVPIVLIMEDADSSLATRQMDNVSRLSDLLNMSDGLLGEMSDIRILATTNSKKSDLDSAVLRPGRLNEHITLKLLTPEHARNVFHRLTGKNETPDFSSKGTTLADVYRLARSHGWKPEPRVKRKKRSFHSYRDCGF